jgi:hypothetical protein
LPRMTCSTSVGLCVAEKHSFSVGISSIGVLSAATSNSVRVGVGV